MSSGSPVADPALGRRAPAPPGPSPALDFTRGRRARVIDELKELIRFPSVSARPSNATDLQRCAEWLAAHLRGVGLQRVSIVPTDRHPAVLGHGPRRPGRPTVLVYGHYDVQPADPLAAWSTPPFEPIIRGDRLYGRGSCDDKGQLFAHVKALEGFLKTVGGPPVNVTCLFDGEEEIGSPGLEHLLTRRRRELAADVAVMSDTRMLGPDRPAITFALRGSLGLELKVLGSPSELHSGNFGGAVHNPLQGLCEIVARLHDERGRVAVPGFYDDVRLLSPAERRRMRKVGPSNAQITRDAGARSPWGEARLHALRAHDHSSGPDRQRDPGRLPGTGRQERHPGGCEREASGEAHARSRPEARRTSPQAADRRPHAADATERPAKRARDRRSRPRPSPPGDGRRDKRL